MFDLSFWLCIIKAKGDKKMENGGPYREGLKSEKIMRFLNSYKNDEGTCIDNANRWLQEHVGKIEIFLRDVAKDKEGQYRSVLIWYRER